MVVMALLPLAIVEAVKWLKRLGVKSWSEDQ
jgi:hypothetical protein